MGSSGRGAVVVQHRPLGAEGRSLDVLAGVLRVREQHQAGADARRDLDRSVDDRQRAELLGGFLQ